MIVLAALAAAGCSGECDCEACPPALSLDIVVPGGAVPEVSGSPELSCESAAGMTYCFRNDAVPGEYTYTISAAGRPPQSVTLTVGPGGSGCCACEVAGAYARVQFEILDGGADASTSDAAIAGDAGMPADAGTCNPDRVSFPAGGYLSPGTLCDDVFVCVARAADAARVTAASSSFDCASDPSGYPCGEGIRCRYSDPGGPSTLDEAEITEICAVTLLEPPLESIVCMVYI